ncbi:MAG: Ig-like domain repeat protein [Oligoflexales bacterium]
MFLRLIILVLLASCEANVKLKTVSSGAGARPPVTIVPTNEAADGFVNAKEIESEQNLFLVIQESQQTKIFFSQPYPMSDVGECDGSLGLVYGTESLPLINSLPKEDGALVFCLKIVNHSGTEYFDKSPIIIRDTTPPVIDGPSEVFSNKAVKAPIEVFGGKSYFWTKITGRGNLEFSDASIPDPVVSSNQEDAYSTQFIAVDEAGNGTTKHVVFKFDFTPPVFNSLNAINEAEDGYVNAAELTSHDPAFVLSYTSDANTVAMYSPFMLAQGLICGSKTSYSLQGVPKISDIPATDEEYAVCVRIEDSAGNVIYGMSEIVTRDTQAPIVDVGADLQTKTAVTLDATTSGATSHRWEQMSGPAGGALSFSSASSQDTSVIGSGDGNYVVRLTAMDSAGNEASDDLILLWDSTPPTVDVGSDITTGAQVNVNASSSNDAVTYSWSKVSGPGAITFGTSTSEDTTISANQSGSYILRLTVADALGNAASDDLLLSWNVSSVSANVGANQISNSSISINAVSTNANSWTWTVVSGPGNTIFSSPNAEDTTVSVDQDGNYVLQLMATDTSSGASGSDEMVFIKDSVDPTVDVGADVSAKTSITANATSDGTGTNLSYTWTKVSGPGSVVFSTPSNEDTSVFATVDGSYVIGLTVTDEAGNFASDQFTYVLDTTPPAVNAGVDENTNVLLAHDATVAGAATYQWSKISGPGAITFSAPTSEDTDISAAADGTYVLRLTATDSVGNEAFDEINFVWDASAPTVNAGADISTRTITTTSGSAAGAANYAWTQISGPGTVSFGNSSLPNTTIMADIDGSYVLRLTAIDGTGNSAFDDLTYILDTTAPTVDAGLDESKKTSFSHDATVTGATTFLWSKVSGPGVVIFGSPTTEDTDISASQDGTYVIRLTAGDSLGNAESDDFILSWDNLPPSVNVGTDLTSKTVVNLDATTFGAATFAWSQVSGPGVITFGSTTVEDTTAAADQDGTYVLRLTASDDAGNANYDELTLVWDTTPPTVNAGGDQIVNAITAINATVSGASTYQWTKISGSGTVTFNPDNTEDTLVTATSDDTYVLRLTATDLAGNSAYDEISFTWLTLGPTVDAGPDLITGSTINIDATTASGSNFLWTKISGPGAITFGSNTSEDTSVQASLDGTYLLRLRVTDGAANQATDEVVLEWDTVPPVVNAGPDLTVNATPSIDATVTGATTYNWSKVSGPGTVTFGSPTMVDTNVTVSADGVYVLSLSATDSAGNVTTDDITLTWDSSAPTVNAGADILTKVLTNVNATVTGAATYSWSQVSGPGSITFSSPTQEDTSALADADGSYVLRLTATDSAGNSASDDVNFVWDTTPPSVNVGSDVSAASSHNIDATVTGSAVTYQWAKISGPGAITFGSSSSEDTSVMAATDGIYVLRLTATDGAGNVGSDELQFEWDTQAPTINVGADITTNTQVSRSATVSGAATYQWSQTSGPGTISFGSATNTSTTISASAEGTYVVRLTATDALNNASFDEFTFVWDTTPPSVDVGADVITHQNVVIDATTSGGATYAWTKVSGSGTINFGAASAEDTSVATSADDVYVLRLTVTDEAGNSASDELNFTWDTSVPTVDIGSDVTARTQFTIDATTSGSSSYSWTKVSGPGTVTFGSASAEDTNVSAGAEGIYVIRLTVTDAASNSASDDLTLTWDTTAPTVNAGADIVTNSQVLANATATGADNYQWSQISGPGTITFGTATSEDTTLSASAEGTYVIRLTTSDTAGNPSFDEISFVWDVTPPAVNVGSNVTTNTAATVNASSTDAATYQWTKISGSGSITFGTPNAEDTTVAAGADDTYVLRLTVTDAAGNTAFDELDFTWLTGGPSVSVGADVTTNVQVSVNAVTSNGNSYSWTKISGPGTVNFGSASAEDTTISASAEGTYVIRLTVTDIATNTASDDLVFTWDVTPPTVNAGADVSARIAVTQNATVVGAATYQWSKVSGPGTIAFGSATSEGTTISANTEGAYVLRLIATDSAGNSASDDINFTWDTTAPSVNAGVDVNANAAVTLNATVTGAVSYQWTKQSGSGSINFGTPTAEDTTASAGAEGSFVLRLTATDAAGNTAFDEMTFVWDTTAPTVNVGSDLNIKAQASINATSSGANTYSWTKQSGPGTVTFGTASAEDTTISAGADGTYVIRLTVTDTAGNTSNDELTMIWDTVAPVVNAGPDISAKAIVTANATVTGATSYQWTKVSGTGTITFGSATAEDTTITASQEGSFVLRLTATDVAGNSASDDITFVWDTTAPTVNVGADRVTNTQVSVDATSSGATTYQWTKISGAGTVTFGSATAEDTTISASADGVYVIRLTTTDAAGNSAFDELSFTWDVTAPSVNVGGDIVANAQTNINAVTSGGATYQWTKASGPGTVTFTTPTAEDTAASMNTDGAYVLRLTVTDAAGNSAFDELNFTRDTAAPTVNAGADLVANATKSINATVTGAITYSWTKQSGPGTITFGSASAEDTTAFANSEGSYVLRLTATDAAGNSAFDELSFVWDTTAPSVNVGADRTEAAQFTLNATVTGSPVSYQWSKVSGTGTITFGSATSEDTTISASQNGTFVIRLTATDAAGNAGTDDFTLTWSVVPLTVDVGADIYSSGSSSFLNATVTGNITNYSWTQTTIQGSPVGSIQNPSSQAATYLTPGICDFSVTLRLTVTDVSSATAYDELVFTCEQTPPVVNAGADLKVKAQTTINATASDAFSGIASYQWTKVSGPGTITFGTATSEDTTASANAEGAYVLRLTVTDRSGNSASDDINFTWDTIAPSVNAGSTIRTGSQVTQNATVTEQGSGMGTYQWSTVSGPGTVTYGTATAEDTTVSASAGGTYVLQLQATDLAGNAGTGTVTMYWDTTNPVVSAGLDVSAKVQVTLNGSASDAQTGIQSVQWTKVSGTGTITFGTATATSTTVSASADGTYVLQLAGTNQANGTTNDQMTFIWDTTPPTVNAGADLTIRTSTAINATTSGAATFAWTKVSGPGTVTFTAATSEDTSVSANTDGSYVIRLTATDAAGNSATDDVTMVWDTVAPTATISGQPTGTNGTTVLNIDVLGTGVTAYKYKVGLDASTSCSVTTGYSAERDVSTDITDDISSLADGLFRLCVIGRDLAGNYQLEASATTVTWTKQIQPPTGYVLVPKAVSGLAYDYYIMQYEAHFAGGVANTTDTVTTSEANKKQCEYEFHVNGNAAHSSCGTKVSSSTVESLANAVSADYNYPAAWWSCRNSSTATFAMRLPTREEWVRAAKASSSNTYSSLWTKYTTDTGAECNSTGAAVNTGSRANCKAHLDVYDVAGNRGEWVDEVGVNYTIAVGEARLGYRPTVARTFNGIDGVVRRFNYLSSASSFALRMGNNSVAPSNAAWQQYGPENDTWKTISTSNTSGFRCVAFRKSSMPALSDLAVPKEPVYLSTDMSGAASTWTVPENRFIGDTRPETVQINVTGNLTDSVAEGNVAISWRPWAKTYCTNAACSTTSTLDNFSYEVYRFVEPTKKSIRFATTWALSGGTNPYGADVPLDPLAVNSSNVRVHTPIATISNCTSAAPANCTFTDSTTSGTGFSTTQAYYYMVVAKDAQGNTMTPKVQRHRSPYFAGALQTGQTSTFRLEDRMRRAAVLLVDKGYQESRTVPQVMVHVPMDKSGLDHDFYIYKYEPAPNSGSDDGGVAEAAYPNQQDGNGGWVSSAATCHDKWLQNPGTFDSTCGSNSTTTVLKSETGIDSGDQHRGPTQGDSWKACRNSSFTAGTYAYRLYLPSASEWIKAADWGDTDQDGDIDINEARPSLVGSNVRSLETSTCNSGGGSASTTGTSVNCQSRYGAYDMVGSNGERSSNQTFDNWVGLDDGMDGYWYGMTFYNVSSGGSTTGYTKFDLFRGGIMQSGGYTIDYGSIYEENSTGLYAVKLGGSIQSEAESGRFKFSNSSEPEDTSSSQNGRCAW